MWIKLSTWKFRRAERRRRTDYKVKNDLNKEEEGPQQPNPFLKNPNLKIKKIIFSPYPNGPNQNTTPR